MSLDYSLYFVTALTPLECLALLAHELELGVSNPKHPFKPDVVWLAAIPALPTIKELTEEAFGFRPTLSVGFVPHTPRNEFDGYYEGLRLMMRGVNLLLSRDSEDAVLLFNGEHVVLQKLKGQLTLNTQFFDFANHEQTLPELTLDYELRDIKSPLL